MKAQRILALLLLLIPLGTLAYMSQRLAFPAVVCAVGVVGAWGRFQIESTRARRLALGVAAGVAAGFAVKWMVSPPLILGSSSRPFFSVGVIDYTLAYHAAQGVLAYQASLFFLRREDGLPRVLPLYAAFTMVMAGMIPTPVFGGWRDVVFQTASLTLAVVTGLYFMTGVRYHAAPGAARRKWAICGLLLLIIVVSGWVLGKALYRYGDGFDRYLGTVFTGRLGRSTIGFSTDGRLGAIDRARALGGNATALRIFSEDAPGYLRGKVFDTYEMPRWSCSAVDATLAPVAETDAGGHWFALHEIGPANVDGSHAMDIQRAASLKNALFAPLEAAWLCAGVRQLSINAYGVAQSDQLPPGAPYQVAGRAAPASALNVEARAQLTAVPEKLDPRVKDLAAQITQSCATDAAKIDAVARYLTSNYRYDLGAGPAYAADPVAAFLLDVRKGHCEFFASAATLLLRCAGVPCRYVTGFVADTQNRFGGYWIARNKDAHAWAEAYVDGRGWVLVEATPASGVPNGETSMIAQVWDYVRYLPRAALAAIQRQGIRAALLALATRFGGVLLAALAIAAVIATALRLRKRARGRPRRAADPRVTSLQRLLVQMDRRLAKEGFVRAGSETLHHFAARIESEGQQDAAQWYRAYAARRYDPRCATSGIPDLS